MQLYTVQATPLPRMGAILKGSPAVSSPTSTSLRAHPSDHGLLALSPAGPHASAEAPAAPGPVEDLEASEALEALKSDRALGPLVRFPLPLPCFKQESGCHPLQTHVDQSYKTTLNYRTSPAAASLHAECVCPCCDTLREDIMWVAIPDL